MEALEEISKDTISLFSGHFPSRINVSSIHLLYDHDKPQIINLILSNAPEIAYIYQLDKV